jgi:hypothetical protein
VTGSVARAASARMTKSTVIRQFVMHSLSNSIQERIERSVGLNGIGLAVKLIYSDASFQSVFTVGSNRESAITPLIASTRRTQFSVQHYIDGAVWLDCPGVRQANT